MSRDAAARRSSSRSRCWWAAVRSRAEVDASVHDHDHGDIPIEPLDGGPEDDAAPRPDAARSRAGCGTCRPASRRRSCPPTTRCPPRRSSSGGTSSTTRALAATRRSRARPATSRRARSPTGASDRIGSTGEMHPRSSMGLANVAYAATLTWANPLLLELEAQALVPMFGDEPVELGLRACEDELIARLARRAALPGAVPAAFPDDADPFTVANVARAIAAFERTLISGGSPYDRFVYGGDANALSDGARAGHRPVLLRAPRVLPLPRRLQLRGLGRTTSGNGSRELQLPQHRPLQPRRAPARTRRAEPGVARDHAAAPRTWAASARRRCATSR